MRKEPDASREENRDVRAAKEPPATRAATGEIEIEAPVEAVWKALTDARELERWFPLEARVEPGEGGAVWMSWRNEYEGESKILKWDPPRHLRTTWEMHEGDQPPQLTDYRLESKGGRTIVRVVTRSPSPRPAGSRPPRAPDTRLQASSRRGRPPAPAPETPPARGTEWSTRSSARR